MPWLGVYKRYADALATRSRTLKPSYSQYGEDALVVRILQGVSEEVADISYVDVGANHPNHLSNTYLMYRQGRSGLLIEPNAELAALLRRFRPRDQVLRAGVADRPGTATLAVANTPGLSSFVARPGVGFHRSELVPVLPLDAIVPATSAPRVQLLSIDTEGMNLAVLRGASDLLGRTMVLCVEYDAETDLDDYRSVLPSAFALLHMTACNAIYVNGDLLPEVTS